MAPEFVPFILFGFLILASLGASLVWLVLTAVPSLRRRTWPFPALVMVPTLGLVLATGVCARQIHQAYVLNEPLGIAACGGKTEEVSMLLERGASANACNVDCTHPAIVCAAGGGYTEMVILLLDHGANPAARDIQGLSALDRARQGKHEKVVALLEARVKR